MDIRKRGLTSQMVRVFIPDNTSSKGAGKTGLTSASTNLTIAYQRELDSTPTTYTGANIEAQTTIGTFEAPSSSSKCRFKEVNATSMPGLYEIQFHDSATIFGIGDTSAKVQVNVYEATTTALNIGPNMKEIQLIAFDLQATNLTATAVRTEIDANSTKLDVAVSTRSTYAGGAVASVTAPVTVGTNSDKTGYSLSVSPPSVSDIRTEIDANSTKLDVAVSTRLSSTDSRIPATIIAAQADIQGIFLGTGPNTFVVTVYEHGTTTPVPDYSVSIYASDETTLVGIMVTNASGQITNNLPTDVYKLKGYKIRYAPDNLVETFSIGPLSLTKTIYATPLTSSAAPLPTLQTISGTVMSISGTAKQGVPVNVTLANNNQVIDETVLMFMTVSTTTDVNGYFEIFAPKGAKITVKVGNSGEHINKTFTVTDAAAADIGDYV